MRTLLVSDALSLGMDNGMLILFRTRRDSEGWRYDSETVLTKEETDAIRDFLNGVDKPKPKNVTSSPMKPR